MTISAPFIGAVRQSLNIQNNSCIFIGSLDGNGKYFEVSIISTDTPTDSQDMCQYSSGNVNIENNACSFIHTGIAYEELSKLNISYNQLSAYSRLYLELLNDVSTNSISETFGSAISVTSLTQKLNGVIPGVSTISNNNDSSVFIHGNVTNFGYTISTTYNYLNYIVCQSSAIITNNILKGFNRTPTANLITIGGLINIVKNNAIYRHVAANSCNSYVGFKLLQASIPYDSNGVAWTAWTGEYLTCIITENVFDSPYTSGTTENHIYIPEAYTTAYSIIAERNVNQVSYVNIPLTASKFKYEDDFVSEITGTSYLGSVNTTPSVLPIGQYTSNIIRIHDTDTVNRKIYFQDTINSYLPLDVKICQIKMGIKSVPGATTELTSDSYFLMSITRQDDVISSIDLDAVSGTSGNTDQGEYSQISGTTLNTTTTTHYLTVNLESPDKTLEYTTGRLRTLTAGFTMDWEVVGSNPVDIYISPILVKFRW